MFLSYSLKTDSYYLQQKTPFTNILPVYNFSFPLSCNHIQQSLPQVIPDAAIPYDLISKNDQAQVVDILHIVLLHIHSVLQQGINSNKTVNLLHQCYSKIQENDCFSTLEIGPNVSSLLTERNYVHPSKFKLSSIF